MPLVIDLRPYEKLLVGKSVITNDSDDTIHLGISGTEPVLQEKDVMQEEDARSPRRQIYFIVQCMFLEQGTAAYLDRYFDLVREIQVAAPTTAVFFMKINEMILGGFYYKAMKEARKLIKHEDTLIATVQKQEA